MLSSLNSDFLGPRPRVGFGGISMVNLWMASALVLCVDPMNRLNPIKPSPDIYISMAKQ